MVDFEAGKWEINKLPSSKAIVIILKKVCIIVCKITRITYRFFYLTPFLGPGALEDEKQNCDITIKLVSVVCHI